MVMTVRIDAQGRVVVPQHVRDEWFDTPGEVVVEVTDDGVLLRPVRPQGRVVIADDGLPVLLLGRPVSNEEVVDAIHRERDGW